MTAYRTPARVTPDPSLEAADAKRARRLERRDDRSNHQWAHWHHDGSSTARDYNKGVDRALRLSARLRGRRWVGGKR